MAVEMVNATSGGYEDMIHTINGILYNREGGRCPFLGDDDINCPKICTHSPCAECILDQILIIWRREREQSKIRTDG